MRRSIAIAAGGRDGNRRGLVSTVLLATGAQAAEAQPAKAGQPGTTWSSIAHLPDWSGVWELDWHGGNLGKAAMPSAPKLTPEYAARLEKYRAAQKEGENQQTDTANCDPPGMPQIMTQPYPVEFLFTPGKVTVAIEAYSQMRRIFVDGRKHQEDPDPTYQGDSIGHWEGDTLVVDSIGFIPNSYIAPGDESQRPDAHRGAHPPGRARHDGDSPDDLRPEGAARAVDGDAHLQAAHRLGYQGIHLQPEQSR